MTATILCVVGTRPEAIKMAPVILALRREPWARVRVVATAQHRDMLDEALAALEIVADIDLDIMRPDQALADLTARLLSALDRTFRDEAPSAILAQGDTTTVFTAALAAYYRHIPFCHVEAGLRTGDFDNPFPEEMNRVLAGRLSWLHFAPTKSAAQSLLAEGIPVERIFVTGNTIIDALLSVARHKPNHGLPLPPGKRIVLLTAHRRENFGAPMEAIFRAVRRLCERFPDIHVVYPVHPNPNVSRTAQAMLGDCPDITLAAPLDYVRFVALIQAAHLILTDSGGIQEEAPALSKPVLVLRRETERPEAVAAGVARLVGTEEDEVLAATSLLLTETDIYTTMARGGSPYGDGKAAERIVEILHRHLTDRP